LQTILTWIHIHIGNDLDGCSLSSERRALSLTTAGVRFAFVPMMLHLILWAIGVCVMCALICAKHLTHHLWLCRAQDCILGGAAGVLQASMDAAG